MRTLIILVVGLLAVGCGKPEQPVNTYENKKRVGFLSHRTEAKPVKELTLEEKVVGTYETKRAGDTLKFIFLEDRVFEVYINDERKDGGTWRADGKEVFLEGKGHTLVCKIELNGHLTEIAYMQNGKRAEFSKEEQQTYKKIK